MSLRGCVPRFVRVGMTAQSEAKRNCYYNARNDSIIDIILLNYKERDKCAL